MTGPERVQGSNAERAEGGLNPEASFASVDEATSRRMGREAEVGLVESVRQQIARSPGGKGATHGRDEYQG